MLKKGDHVEIQSYPGTVLKGRVLVADIDWDGEPMALIRYDDGEPARRPYTLWPERELRSIP